MTYPPQQPGQPQDPYQQQPQAQPQYDPYAQQFPQQPQDPYAAPQSGPPAPQSGPPVQDPYAQPGVAYPPQQPQYDPYGQPQPVTGGPAFGGQQPVFGQPPQAPNNKKLGLLVGLGGGGLLLAILIVALVIAMSGGGAGDTVDDYLSALHDHDYETANSLVCDSDRFVSSDIVGIEGEAELARMEWEIISEYESSTEAIVTVSITGGTDLDTDSMDIYLLQVNGDWCVDSWGGY